jgi:V-type H+-transporting ATPase subunit d
MGGLLKSRADRYAINITLNSFGTPLNETFMREKERKSLYPSIGFLYPAGTELLSQAFDESKLGEALSIFPLYYPIWQRHTVRSAHRVLKVTIHHA